MSAVAGLPAVRGSGVGRRGCAYALFERSGERTILRDSFFRVPLQIIRPFYPEEGGPAHLILVNPTGGHVGGDRLEARFVLGDGARVLLTTQGATKVYRSLGEPVLATTEIELGADAEFEMIPDPIIPYRGAMYRQVTRVNLSEGARCLYGEMLYHGRVASGECFDYASVGLRFEAAAGGRPLLRDAVEIRPARTPPRGLGLFEPFPYLGTFYVLGGGEGDLDEIAGRADDLLAGAEGVAGGASRLEGPGVLIRWLADTPVRLRWAFGRIWGIARPGLLSREAVSLRKF